MAHHPEFSPPPTELDLQMPQRNRRWWLLVPLIICPVIVLIAVAWSGLWWLAYEAGTYKSENNIRVTNEARDAFFEARQEHPEAVLFIDEYERFAFRANFVRRFEPRKYIVSVTERGVPLKVEAGGFSTFDVLKPTIRHDGREDKTNGYEVVLKGPAAYYSRKSDFPSPGR